MTQPTSPTSGGQESTGSVHRVPTRIWVVAAVIFLGACVTGVGVALLSIPISVAGAAVFVVACGVAKMFGIMEFTE